MVFTTENTKGKQVKVFDFAGVRINAVTKYNTKTREATIVLVGKSEKGTRIAVTVLDEMNYDGFNRKPVLVKVRIPGSYIVINGKKY